MQKLITVTIESTIRVTIADEHLTAEGLAEFSACITSVGSPEDLFRHVAEQVAVHGPHFVEGVGVATLSGMSDAAAAPITFEVIYEDRSSAVDEPQKAQAEVER